MRAHPDTAFYACTKEVARFRTLVETDAPPNSLWVCSFGGPQHSPLDPATDRVAGVFSVKRGVLS